MIRILLADDHAIVIGGLKQLFALTTDIEVVGEALNGKQVLDLVRKGGIDLVVLDISMPNISGIDLIMRIRAINRELPILVLSMHNELQIARRALTAGANGYVTKDNEPETLLAAIRKVATGGRFIDPTLAQKIAFDSPLTPSQTQHEQLSSRELLIFRLLASGLTVNQIADELSISNKTVSTHKARLMRKMSFSSNAELVRYAVTQGIVE